MTKSQVTSHKLQKLPALYETGRPGRPRFRNGGFTLVELIIAMAFFSFLLVVISVGVIQIMKIYQSNLATRRTQQAARIVVENITREVRTALRVTTVGNDELCLEGSQTVLFRRQEFNNGNDAVLYKRVLQGSCSNPSGVISEEKLAGSDIAGQSAVQVRQFDTSLITSSQDEATSVKVVLAITTGTRDLLEDSGLVCRPGPGSQFCSATSYSSIITLRGESQ